MKRFVGETLKSLRMWTFGEALPWRPKWRRTPFRKTPLTTPATVIAMALYHAAPGPRIRHAVSAPRYIWNQIALPPPQHYPEPDHYFGDLFHELGHDTVSVHRWRMTTMVEELAVEAASGVLCRLSGFEHFWVPCAAYLQMELKRSRNPRRTWAAAEDRARRIVYYVTRT